MLHLGNQVDMHYGTAIIGDIEIADNLQEDVNAVVIKLISEPGCYSSWESRKIVKHVY